jgi:hypothetical protein
MNAKPKIFISYSHPDEAYKQKLEKHLSTLKRNKEIEVWNDRELIPGEEWDKEINDRLLDADIILLLISSDFLASDYCNDVEVAKAMEFHESRKASVVPVILRSCDWHRTLFSKLQGLPKDGKPISLWPDVDEAFLEVIKGIRKLIAGGKVKEEEQVEENADIIKTLKEVPVFPMVEAEDVPASIIESVSKAIGYSESELLINEANRLRRSVDPENTKVTVIQLHRLPSPLQTTSINFWIHAFREARLNSPRMLASLLLSIPDNIFSEQVRKEKETLLQLLKKYKK